MAAGGEAAARSNVAAGGRSGRWKYATRARVGTLAVDMVGTATAGISVVGMVAIGTGVHAAGRHAAGRLAAAERRPKREGDEGRTAMEGRPQTEDDQQQRGGQREKAWHPN